MGLDLYDLVLAIEKEFDVELSEKDAQTLVTAGDLYDFVIQRTKTISYDNYLATGMLHELQTALKACDVSERVKPTTQLHHLFPAVNLRSQWSRLSSVLDRKIPELVRPNWVLWCNLVATIGLSVLVFVLALRTESAGALAPLFGILSLFLFGHLTAGATKKLATEMPPELKTIGDLSERMVGLNYKDLKHRYKSIGKQDVWLIIKEIMADCLGVDHDEITKDARLVEDLGCD